MKNSIKKIFILTGLLPATFLLGLTIIFLPSFIRDLSFEFDDIFLPVSMIFGICGFIGLLLSIMPKFEDKRLLKLVFLILGILGSIMFISIAGGKEAWTWILKIEEFDEWIIAVWPLIVSIVLIYLNIQKIFNKKHLI
jgi:FtsH-binding integral membrane protein